MANVTFKFAAPAGYTPTLEVFRDDTLVSLDSGAASESAADGYYTVVLDVGAYTGGVVGVLTNPSGTLFGSTVDGIMRGDPAGTTNISTETTILQSE